MERVLSELSKSGAKLEKGWPQGIEPRKQQFPYFFLMSAVDAMGMSPERIEATRRIPGANENPFLASKIQPHRNWMQFTMQRLAARNAWQRYFQNHDVFLTPTTFAPAFRHRQQDSDEKLPTPEGPRDYMDLIYYVGPVTFAGIPATSAPVGRTPAGLPVGLQIAGPYMEDGTPIAFAEELAKRIGGFTQPAGY
jgi:amidase